MTKDLQLIERVDRLEAIEAISQLPIRYALAVDGRDVEAWVDLFVEDVDCGQHGQGRPALRRFIEPQLRKFYRSIHQICGHEIVLDGADRARGTVYCRAEHEAGERWIVMAIAYFDEYARRGGKWLFVRRREKHWYSADWEQRPAAPFRDWDALDHGPRLPGDFPAWEGFWRERGAEEIAVLSSLPIGGRSP